MPLTSIQNPLLKNIRRAAAAGRPTDQGLIVAEGPNLLHEAIRSTWEITQIFCTDSAWHKHGELLRTPRAEVVQVSSRALSSTSAAETSQEIIALLRPPIWSWADIVGKRTLAVVLDGIQDPGNAGTIVRSAEAFGATGIVFLEGSTRISNGKFLRASAGSIFRLPFIELMAPADFIEKSAADHIPAFSLDMRRSVKITEADLRQPCALIVGNEGGGIRSEILESSRAISIPTRKVESLNAAVACSLALFEAFVQRSRR
jgi:TrmH family RNA methyltransferase